MKKPLLAALATALLAVVASDAAAADRVPHGNQYSARFAQSRTWHGNYRQRHYQQPLALVVPPTASTQTVMGWGVGQTEIRSLHHQYQRAYPAYGGDFSQFRTAPYWPSHTDQFGVYYIRGPWGHY